LLRPMSYALSLLGKAMGERVVRFVLNVFSGSIVALILVGPLRISASGLAMFVLALPLAFVIDFLGYLIVGLCAFWLESTIGLAIIYSRVTMLLGGMLMPLEIFPKGWQPILAWLPFASVVYGPARIFVAADIGLLWSIARVQLLSLMVFGLVAGIVQNRAVKRIQSNGG
jgi:ABC-2 type transport system permease protein